jgi:SAM-dependent methyltransferase
MSTKQYIDRTEVRGGPVIPPALHSLKNGYALDNSHIQAGDRLAALDQLFDPGTIHHLEDRGVASGWQCLEVGGGTGSIATWLSERVGPSGRVVVTDINTRFLDALQRPNLEVRKHNIVTDPLPEGAFDLVHVRLVLMHVPERDAVLSRLIKALKPGGWLVDEEYDVLSTRPDPDLNRFEKVLNTTFAVNRVLTEHGVELRFGRLLHGRLHALGLAEVGSEARLFMGAGGSVAATLLRSRCCQLRDEMVEGGYISAKEFEDDLQRLDDPDRLILTPTLWAAWGRRSLKPLGPVRGR